MMQPTMKLRWLRMGFLGPDVLQQWWEEPPYEFSPQEIINLTPEELCERGRRDGEWREIPGV